MLEYLLSQDKSVRLELLERLLPLLHESQRPMKLRVHVNFLTLPTQFSSGSSVKQLASLLLSNTSSQ
jgi:hypothetical protein